MSVLSEVLRVYDTFRGVRAVVLSRECIYLGMFINSTDRLLSQITMNTKKVIRTVTNLACIRHLGPRALSQFGMRQIRLPECLYIEHHALSDCESLEVLDLPMVRTLGEEALSYCWHLKTVSVPSCVVIDAFAFKASGLQDFQAKSLEVVEKGVFMDCIKLSRLNIANCRTVGALAFARCRSLQKVDLPKVRYLGAEAFLDCIRLDSLSILACLNDTRSALSGCYSLRHLVKRKQR